MSLAPNRSRLGRVTSSLARRRVVVALGWNSYRQEHSMMDVIVLGLGVVFFVATIAYAYACDRL